MNKSEQRQKLINNAFYAQAHLQQGITGKVSLKLFRKMTADIRVTETPDRVNLAEFITFNKFKISVDI